MTTVKYFDYDPDILVNFDDNEDEYETNVDAVSIECCLHSKILMVMIWMAVTMILMINTIIHCG